MGDLARQAAIGSALILAALVAVRAPLAADVAAGAGGSLERVRKQGTLRWGADLQGGEPYAFQDPNDSHRVIGFEVEIADALAARLGVKAELVQNDWSTLIPSLERGDFDIALNGIEVTMGRLQRVAFSKPYYHFTETLVVRRDQAPELHGLDDLTGRRVGTLANSLAHELLRQDPSINIALYEGVEEPFIDLAQGRSDAVVLDHIIAERYGLRHPNLVAAATVGEGAYAIALRQEDRTLKSALDDGLDEMRQNGELRAILERWNIWTSQQLVEHGTPAMDLRRDVSSSSLAPTEPGTYLTRSQVALFLRGALVTLVISTLAMSLAVSLGLMLGLIRQYSAPWLQLLAQVYVEVFRGTPVLLQLYLIYYGLAPFFAMHAFTAAVIGLGLNYAAYEAELYRAGLTAVPLAQTEAALALGMSRRLAVQRIVLPQALRVSLPGMTNDFIALLKDSSLVSVISVVELTKQMTITAVDLRGWLVPGMLCAGLYMLMSLPLARLARHLEDRLARQR